MKSPFQSRMRSRQSSGGFSLLEVLVSVLMIAGFLATAMQALISATAIKVRSEEISEATSWMQEDLEALKFEANRLDFDPAAGPNGDGDYDPQQARCNSSTYATELANRINSPRQPSLPSGNVINPAPPYAADNQNKESSIGGRDYRLIRTLEANDNMLAVSYDVVRDPNPNGQVIGELYAEIIPDVAFYCDQG